MFTRILVSFCSVMLIILTSMGYATPSKDHSGTDWFNQTFVAQGTARAAIVFLLAEYRKGAFQKVAKFSRALIRSGRPTIREKAELYQILALAERKIGNPVRERRAWMQFYNLTFSSDALLQVVILHQDSGEHQQALKIANRVQLERLSANGKIKWYRVIGTLYHATRQFNNSLYIREKLVEMQPNGENAFHYSETLIALGQYDKAYSAIKRALNEDPDNRVYWLNKAHILNAIGEYSAATEITQKLASDGLINRSIGTEIQTHRAQKFLKSGEKGRAKQAYIKALNALNSNASSNSLNRHLVDLSQLSIQSEIRHLDSQFEFGASNTICRDDNGCEAFNALGSDQSSPGLGTLFALYRLNNRITLSAGLKYSHQVNGVSLNTDSGIATVGINFQPLKKNNLRVSLERQFAIGDLSENNTKLTLSLNHTKGAAIQPSATNEKSWPYLHLYAEITKLFEQDKDSLAYLEGRYGRTIKLNEKMALSPYFFGQETYRSNDFGSDKKSTEAGLGMALNIDQLFDRHKGSRGHTEIFFRAGRDLYVKEEDEEFRTRLGLEFRYQ